VINIWNEGEKLVLNSPSPCQQCFKGGKWRIGNGKCIYATKALCIKAWKALPINKPPRKRR